MAYEYGAKEPEKLKIKDMTPKQEDLLIKSDNFDIILSLFFSMIEVHFSLFFNEFVINIFFISSIYSFCVLPAINLFNVPISLII